MDRIRKIKGALLMTSILILGGVLVMFTVRRQQTVSDQTGITVENKNTTFAVSGLHYIDMDIEENVKNLELFADSAYLYWDEDRANLSMLQTTFFDPNGDNVFLSAESGSWRMDSNDLEVSGNVMLKTNQYEIETETLTYIDSKGMFTTQSPSTIKGLLWEELRPERITYDLNTRRLYLNGNEAEQ